MDLIFENLLNIHPIKHTKTIMPVDPNAPPQTSGQVAFLKEMLLDKRATADSLMDTAKKISPVSQKIVASEKAYDAAFESEAMAPLPNSSGTLQGFTLIFFTIAFFSLAIVLSVYVNNLTGNTSDALKTFAIFVVIFFILVGMVRHFG